MDHTDFEELIDLGRNLSIIVNRDKQDENNISPGLSQEPISDVLDRMCAAMSDNNLSIEDSLKPDINEGEIDTLVNFERSGENISETLLKSDLILDFTKYDDDKGEFDAEDNFNMPEKDVAMVNSKLPLTKCDTDKSEDNTQCNINEFENILAVTYLSNSSNKITNNDNTNTMINGIMTPVVPYNLPIQFEEIDKTVSEFAALDKDAKQSSFLNLAADNEIENEYNALTAELNVDTSFNGDINELINNCCEAEKVEEVRNEIEKPKPHGDDVNNIDNSDSDDGFNASDFEFISEEEAKKPNTAGSNSPSTSKLYTNEASPSEYLKYSKYRYQRCYAQLSSELHVVPEGEEYLDLFRGQFAPAVNMHGWGNKSVQSMTPMAAVFQDMGFSIPENLQDEHLEYKDEAEECAAKIRATYPSQHRKRTRRF